MKHLILVEIFPRYKKIISGGIEWNSIDVTSLSLSTTFQILVCILALHNVQLYFQRVHTILPFVSSLPPSLSSPFSLILYFSPSRSIDEEFIFVNSRDHDHRHDNIYLKRERATTREVLCTENVLSLSLSLPPRDS